jgi:uncharacterized protein YifE (UPF0438 family)
MPPKFDRHENYSVLEKQLIIEFVDANKDVLENKSSNAKIHEGKKAKWMILSERLAASGIQRDWKHIREAYQRWKLAAKKHISAYNKSLKGTGGGPSVADPNEQDYAIQAITPEDFVEDESLFDSDSLVLSINDIIIFNPYSAAYRIEHVPILIGMHLDCIFIIL